MASPLGQVRRAGLADMLTIANGLCGFAAIALLTMPYESVGWGSSMDDGRLGLVLALVACGLTFDALDGVVARWRGASGLGGHLDLMADVITFGIVPALVLIQSPAGDGAVASVLAPVVGGLYLTAVLVRLAVFASAEDHDHSFTGLPTPPAAVLVLTLLALAPGQVLVLIGTAATALMMVSSYRRPHPGALGMIVMSILACACASAGFAGWISLGAAGLLTAACVFLIGSLEAAAHRLLAIPARLHAAILRRHWRHV
jgi:phosphatidylserine synthase